MFLRKTSLDIEGRKIYVVKENRKILKDKILAYSIVDSNLSTIKNLYNVIYNYEIVYIADFYVDQKMRSMGIGKKLANYVLEKYKEYDISLKPQDDGFWFWKKYNFVDDEKNKDTWILKKNLIK